MESNQILLKYLEEHIEDYLLMLEEFVERESPSHENKSASDYCMKFLEDHFSRLGFEVERIKQKTCGDNLYGELGKGPKSIMFLGHYDTVFPMGTTKTMPFKIEGNKAYGPGVLDMKGGILMGYWALKALLDLNMFPQKTIGIYCNSDEESGSFCSTPLILEKMRDYNSVFVMEPGINDINTIKTKRYGRGTYNIVAHGSSAHSGSNPHLAASPLIELAYQLQKIEEWNKNTEDATFAPTYIKGGIPGTCMVPEKAYFTMDVRYRSDDSAKIIHDQIMGLQPITPNVRIEVEGKIDKPVMIGDEELFRRAIDVGKNFGLDVKGVSIGGGSDGNFTSSAGKPTLDGLGTTGEFLHNEKEYIHINHIPYRTAMVAKLIQVL